MATPFRSRDALVPVFSSLHPFLIGGLWLAGLAQGCSSPPTSLVESPLTVDEQQHAVLEVVPIGSARDEAERRLKAAGIEYTASPSQTIYYLSLWNRQDGQRWHINVALLFDGQGKLYASRPGDTPVERTSAPASQPGWRRAGANLEPVPLAHENDENARVPFPGQTSAPGASR